MGSRSRRLGALLAGLALSGCLGRVGSAPPGTGSPGDPGGALPAGTTLDAAASTLHRLTPLQYAYTVRDLLGLADADVANVKVALDEGVIPSLLTISSLDDAATLLASLRAHWKAVPCDPMSAGSPECATQFINDFASRAFRHPVTPDELQWLQGVYVKARAQFGFADSIDALARVILQAPSLFYVHEEGEAAEGLPEGLYRVAPYEMASRLSYLFWDSMPDADLFGAAAQRRLASAGDLQQQARRMLADPRARAKVIRFVTKWTELDGTTRHVSIEEAPKDPKQFPLDNPAMRSAMRQEIGELVGHVWDTGGSVSDLFTSNQAYVNGPLAQLYGVAGGPTTADSWAWVSLDPMKRAGLATRAAFLMIYSAPDIPSPIRRGSAVWREFMCFTFPPPPPDAMDVKITGGAQDASGMHLTIRQTVDLRTNVSSNCTGCHSIVNPAGFPFSHYDAYGQWQDVEVGTAPDGTKYSLPIDASGELKNSDVPGPVDGAVALSQKLAQSRTVKDCVASRWWEEAFGRPPVEPEKTSIAYVRDQLAATGNLPEALVAIVASPAFQYLRKEAP
jgi:hypothetical protein